MSENNKIELSGIFANGYGIIPKALMQRQDLTISEKAIIAYFLSYTGAGSNTCFPSYAQICQDLRISKTTLSKCIHSIENKGYIKISALYPNDKLKHNYKYTLLFFEGLKSKPSEVNNLNILVKESKPTCIKNLNSNNNIINSNIINNNNTVKDLIKYYFALLNNFDITYIPIDKDYIVFTNAYKKYVTKISHDEIKRLMDKWFTEKIGSWCGYKLSNFFMDISKVQSYKDKPKKQFKSAKQLQDERIINNYNKILEAEKIQEGKNATIKLIQNSDNTI